MEFTNEEKERINALYGNDFEGVTPEDAKLICRWEAWKATEQARNEIEMEEIKKQTDAKVNEMKRQSDDAFKLLSDLRDMAVKRFERLEANEQEK